MSNGLRATIEEVVDELLAERERGRGYKIEDINKDLSPQALQQLNDYLSHINPLDFSLQNVRGFLTTGAMVVVERRELAVDGGIDFQNITQGFKHLRLMLYLRSNNSGTDEGHLRFNNDSGTNYFAQKIQSVAAATASSELLSQTAVFIGNVPGDSATTNLFSLHEVIIPFYTGANTKLTFTPWFRPISLATGGMQLGIVSGAWNSTAAINRVGVILTGGSALRAGSIATLYAHN